MKLTLPALAFAALVAALPAHATIYTVNFTGTVSQSQGATGQAIGSTVSGKFDLNSVTSSFLDFSIGSQFVASGFQSFASIGPAYTDAIYTAQVSPLATGMTSNNSFSLDLSSLTNWPATDTAYTLLTDRTQLTTNLDTVTNPLSAFPSTFSYYTANANGTGVVSLAANLTSVNVTATPEPATFGLLASALAGLGLWARRRRA